MHARWWIVLLAMDLSAFAFLGVWGTGYGQTDLVMSFTATHGLDTGDLPVITFWVAGMVCCWQLWRRVG